MHSPWSDLLNNLENWKKKDEEVSLGEQNWEPTEIMMEIRDTVADARETKSDPEPHEICEHTREYIYDTEFSEGIFDEYSKEDLENEWLDHLLLFTEKEGEYELEDDKFARWYSQNGNWRGLRISTGLAQGWKIHISAGPDSGREVLETLQPYMLEESIAHKARDSVKTVQNKLDDDQPDRAKKFLTIYPEPDEDMLVDGEQVFEPGNEDLNRRSMTANQERTEEVMEELYTLLAENNLLEGETIDGRNGSEVQVGDSRVHFRYGGITRGIEPTVIGGREQVINTDSIFDPTIRGLDENCEQIGGYTHPNKIAGIGYINTPKGSYIFD